MMMLPSVSSGVIPMGTAGAYVTAWEYLFPIAVRGKPARALVKDAIAARGYERPGGHDPGRQADMPGDVTRAGPREPSRAAGECHVAGWRGCAIAPAGHSGRRTRADRRELSRPGGPGWRAATGKSRSRAARQEELPGRLRRRGRPGS